MWMIGATTERELASLFEAIFEAAPASNADDAVFDHLSDWNELLWQIYPDYQMDGTGNLWGTAVTIDQPFVLQMVLAAYQNVPIACDLAAAAHALSIDETRLRLHDSADALVTGTAASDYFLLGAGNQTHDGGEGDDYYFVGRGAGQDLIRDIDQGAADALRFSHALAADVSARRAGEDLVLQIAGGSDQVRVEHPFLG